MQTTYTGHGFGAAVKSAFSQYATFSGRATRSEYWFFFLFCFIVLFAAEFICGIMAGAAAANGASMDAALSCMIPYYIVVLALMLPSLSIGARRLHDIGMSGWLQLVYIIPFVGFIMLLVWNCKDTQRGTNKYGPSIKYPN